MSSFFEDGDESDEDRTEMQRVNLSRIKQEAPNDSDERGKDEECQQEISDENILSEQDERERLRKDIKYRRYARKGRMSPSKEHFQPEKRPRTDRSKDIDDQDAVVGPSFRNRGDREALPDLGLDMRSAALNEPKEMPGFEGHGVVQPRKTFKRRNPNVDPKIIDDSSDESSSGESDDWNNTPVGPSLPADPREGPDPTTEVSHLPVENEVTLGGAHGSYVSCLAVDKAGNRLVSGSLDSTAKFWDFNSMNRSLRSFRSIHPLEESPLRSIQFSSSGGMILCSGGDSSALVMDREGLALSHTAKGDMYIVDSGRTKGHTSGVLSAKWKPDDGMHSKSFVTTSADATVRVWDVTRTTRSPMVNTPIISQHRVMKLRNSRGAKVIASTTDWFPDEKTCALGCSDGVVRIIDPNIHSVRPIDSSSPVGSSAIEVTSVACAPSTCCSPLILVRSMDDALCVFDRRKMSTILKKHTDLPNAVSETNICFIGDAGEHFVTGTSANRKGGTVKGTLRVYSASRLMEVWKSELDNEAGSAVFTMWHASLNQIIYGTGDGKVRVLFHPNRSSRGVLQSLSKSDYRRVHGLVSVGGREAFRAGYTLENSEEKRKALSNRFRRAASLALKPKSYSGPHRQSGDSLTLAKHLSTKTVSRDWAKDPREAILEYADVAEREPQFTKAYQDTQPKTILTEKTAEQEEDETRHALYERDRVRKAQLAKKRPPE